MSRNDRNSRENGKEARWSDLEAKYASEIASLLRRLYPVIPDVPCTFPVWWMCERTHPGGWKCWVHTSGDSSMKYETQNFMTRRAALREFSEKLSSEWRKKMDAEKRGKINFEAYKLQVQNLTHDRKPIPEWQDLSENVRAGWRAGADAVFREAMLINYMPPELKKKPGQHVCPQCERAFSEVFLTKSTLPSGDLDRILKMILTMPDADTLLEAGVYRIWDSSDFQKRTFTLDLDDTRALLAFGTQIVVYFVHDVCTEVWDEKLADDQLKQLKKNLL